MWIRCKEKIRGGEEEKRRTDETKGARNGPSIDNLLLSFPPFLLFSTSNILYANINHDFFQKCLINVTRRCYLPCGFVGDLLYLMAGVAF